MEARNLNDPAGMSEANTLTNKILDFLYRKEAYGWRQNSTGIYDQRKGCYRPGGKKGVSDILACLPPAGKLLAVEIKIGRDVTSPEQQGFIANIQHVGGYAIVVKTFEEFTEWWDSIIGN